MLVEKAHADLDSGAAMPIARVAVDIAHAAVADAYDYMIPEEGMPEMGSRVLVPFGRRRVQGFVLGFSDVTDVPRSKLRRIERVLDPFPVLREADLALAHYLAEQYHMPLVQAVRTLLPAKLRQDRPALEERTYAELAVDDLEWDAAVGSLLKKDGTVRYTQQMEVLMRLREAPHGLPAGELPSSTVKTLRKKGYVRLTRRAQEPSCASVPQLAVSDEVALTAQQEAAVQHILESDKRNFLLHGVTGSGKTEVYIQVVRRVLAQGRGAVILVPEIALTPQIYQYLQRRLGVRIALFHSKLTEAERFQQWNLVRSGQAQVVLGPRSAVFAPVENLGAIIIDEEQESSYKSGRYPAYTAKEIARFRADHENAFLILGSATPSVETFKEAQEGAWELVTMPNRLFGALLPKVEIVDMRTEVQKGNPGIISEKLDTAIRGALADGTQTMILLNRRGYSSFLMCTSCGTALSCDQCDVSMTYHKSEGMLKCHYCGQKRTVPEVCPECGAAHLKRVGIGTQKLEEQLHIQYPSARILRMDADTMSGRGAHAEAYESFRAGEADILVGTQMIAKGFDFDRVTVAAVLAADSMLHLPDYRSAERTFDQITQLAGRAGRKLSGHVFVQTYSPDHYAIQHAANHDFEGFFAKEAAYRLSMRLPPYGEHILVQFASTQEPLARQAAKDFLGRMRNSMQKSRQNIIRARASESPIKRIQGTYRYQILLHLHERDPQIEAEMYELLKSVSYDHVLVGIDVNPIDMY